MMRPAPGRLIAVALLALALPLAGCGKKGPPKSPSQSAAEEQKKSQD